MECCHIKLTNLPHIPLHNPGYKVKKEQVFFYLQVVKYPMNAGLSWKLISLIKITKVHITVYSMNLRILNVEGDFRVPLETL
jgi:hypothetical protein